MKFHSGDMRVLAIDPGYERVGFAVLGRTGGTGETVLYSNCFTTPSKNPFPFRLKLLGEEMDRLIAAYRPNACAIEKVYFASNQKTALGVSEARGVFLYTAARNGLDIFEYTPLEVKNAVTGDGRSDKRQVISMIQKLVPLEKTIGYDDEYDAIAIGLTCLASNRGLA